MIDSHCHLDFPEFKEQLPELWEAVRALGLSSLIIPSVCPEKWARAQALAESLEGCYWAAGLHPWWVEAYCKVHSLDDLYQALSSLDLDHKCVALGETGLDAAKGGSLDQQIAALEIHARVAKEKSKPLILHQHKTQSELFSTLKPFMPQVKGVIHAFSGSYEQAKQWVDMGFYLGVGGVITYPRANKTRSAIQKIPLNYLVLETDAPAMPLFGAQGKINSPLQLPVIASVLAELKATSIEDIQCTTSLNSARLFGIPHAG